MSQKHQKKKNATERPSKNAVIITYYVESSSQQKKLKPNPFPKKAQTTRKYGYDRRAELLAYANELRASDPHNVHWSRKSKRTKQNKWKWPITPARLHVLSIRIFQGREGHWKYKRMESKENTEEVPLFGVNVINNRKKSNSERSSTSDFCRKLKYMLKELSFGCQCYKG